MILSARAPSQVECRWGIAGVSGLCLEEELTEELWTMEGRLSLFDRCPAEEVRMRGLVAALVEGSPDASYPEG